MRFADARRAGALLLAAAALAFAGDADYLAQLPTGDDWINHLKNDLLPFWSSADALGNPVGSFPSTRCDDGTALDFKKPCAPIAGNAYLMTPAQYLVPLSRQTFGYGVAYHLTGDPKYLDWMKAGVDYIRRNTIDPAGGMFETLDLTTNRWGPAREIRDPQQLGYGLLGMAFYYYLTRDAGVLQDILKIKNYIASSYWNASLGTNQWLLANNGSTRFDQKNLVADLDQMNTYLVLLTPLLDEPYQTEWKQTMATLCSSMLGTFYSPADNLMFLSANTAADLDLATSAPDFGHTSKALWMMRWASQMLGDRGLFAWTSARARQHLDRAFLADDGSWAGGVLLGGAIDKNKNWWVYDELDQLSGTMALADVTAGRYLPQTNRYWFQYFVDHTYGEVWNGVDYGTNAPERSYPKAWQWKSAYHDFEHVLVGYITAQQLLGKPFTLYYAFSGTVDPATIHPYYFSATIDSVSGNAVTFHGATSAAASQALATVSTASGLAAPVVPESIATLWGSHLATGSAQASAEAPADTLAGTKVSVKDSAGVPRTAPLFYASPGQVNLMIPAGTAAGTATVTVAASDGTTATGTVQVANVQPGVFQMNASALAAAMVVRVKPDQSQVIENVYQVDAGGNAVARAVPLGPATDRVYLTIFATGIRNAKTVAATVGGMAIPVLYSGLQGTLPGLDQVNIGPLPRSLAGKGNATIVITADGQTANPVAITIQ